MKVSIGIKSDPIQNRYSYEWLFKLMKELEVPFLQLGGFLELPLMEEGFFLDLREKAQKHGIRIKSLFSTYRILGGLFNGDPYFEKAARRMFEQYIHVGSLLGADYVGVNAGPVYLDKMEHKQEGILGFFIHMQELMKLAKEKGLKGLELEVMSCTAEFPSTPEEIDFFMQFFNRYHGEHIESTVPVYLLGDVSHGFVDRNETLIYTNYEIFEHSIPYMSEFHFKNTDSIYHTTFGFSPGEKEHGCVDLARIRQIIDANDDRWPVYETTGYLEHPGPKFGRDYSDYKLKNMLEESIMEIKKYF